MGDRIFGKITFAALTLSAVALVLLYQADRISEWKVAVCSISGALLSVSQTAFDFYDRFLKTIGSGQISNSNSATLRRFRCSGIVLHILGLTFFVVGMAVEIPNIPTKEVNLITLLAFACLFLCMTVKSFDDNCRASRVKGKHER